MELEAAMDLIFHDVKNHPSFKFNQESLRRIYRLKRKEAHSDTYTYKTKRGVQRFF